MSNVQIKDDDPAAAFERILARRRAKQRAMRRAFKGIMPRRVAMTMTPRREER